MSASMRPTLCPRCFRANARLVATVDLPTPPLPLAIAMMFLTAERPGLAMVSSAFTVSDDLFLFQRAIEIPFEFRVIASDPPGEPRRVQRTRQVRLDVAILLHK